MFQHEHTQSSKKHHTKIMINSQCTPTKKDTNIQRSRARLMETSSRNDDAGANQRARVPLAHSRKPKELFIKS